MRSKVPSNSYSGLKSKRSRSKWLKVGIRRFDQNVSCLTMRCSEPGHHITVAIVASRGPGR